MAELEEDGKGEGAVTQVIGVAYTYRPSLSVRRNLTRGIAAFHSSRGGDFSYFYKGDKYSIVSQEQELYLRTDPATNVLAKHWPEPELAILLGERHEIIAYTLANDLTAISIEVCGRSAHADGTYAGKVWNRSGSLGPRFVAASDIDDPARLEIGLKIVRGGCAIYDQRYSTSRSLRHFGEIPDAVVAYYKSFGGLLPPSKKIMIGADGFLPPGTVIMLGTGLIVQRRYFCEPNDSLTVYCPKIGELTNKVVGIA